MSSSSCVVLTDSCYSTILPAHSLSSYFYTLLISHIMGNSASTSCLCLRDDDVVNSSQESLDPLVMSCSNRSSKGQLHLMWKKGRPPPSSSSSLPSEERFSERHLHLATRLIIRKTKAEQATSAQVAVIAVVCRLISTPCAKWKNNDPMNQHYWEKTTRMIYPRNLLITSR